MTYADDYNIRAASVKFNDVANALDGLITRNYAGLTSGTSTTYTATPSPAWTSYTTAGLVVIIPHVSNSGAATINISGLGAKDIKVAGSAIGAGVLQQNIPTIMAYTGTYFEVLLQQTSIPAGTIYLHAGIYANPGYLFCDGASYNTYTYRTLHAVISNLYGGTAYVAGVTDQPGALTTFNVPDFRRRVPVGKGVNDTEGWNDGLAYASRSLAHTHSVPAHYHGMSGAGSTLATTTSGGHGHSTHSSAVVDISHSHASSTVVGTVGGSDGTHTHTMQSAGSHDHALRVEGSAGTTDVISLVQGGTGITDRSDIDNDGDHTHTINTTNSGHGHAFSLSAAGQTLGATNKSLTGTVGGSDGSHSHPLSGSIGLVTGGVDGNAAMTSGSATQPYMFVNYVIKT